MLDPTKTSPKCFTVGVTDMQCPKIVHFIASYYNRL